MSSPDTISGYYPTSYIWKSFVLPARQTAVVAAALNAYIRDADLCPDCTGRGCDKCSQGIVYRDISHMVLRYGTMPIYGNSKSKLTLYAAAFLTLFYAAIDNTASNWAAYTVMQFWAHPHNILLRIQAMERVKRHISTFGSHDLAPQFNALNGAYAVFFGRKASNILRIMFRIERIKQ